MLHILVCWQILHGMCEPFLKKNKTANNLEHMRFVITPERDKNNMQCGCAEQTEIRCSVKLKKFHFFSTSNQVTHVYFLFGWNRENLKKYRISRRGSDISTFMGTPLDFEVDIHSCPDGSIGAGPILGGYLFEKRIPLNRWFYFTGVMIDHFHIHRPGDRQMEGYNTSP